MALKCNKEALAVDKEALTSVEKVLKGDGEVLKVMEMC